MIGSIWFRIHEKKAEPSIKGRPLLTFSLCTLCVLCVSVVNQLARKNNHRDTENTEGAQRKR